MRFFFERIFDLSFDLKKKKDTVYIKNLCIRSKRFSYYAIFASLRDIQYTYTFIHSLARNKRLTRRVQRLTREGFTNDFGKISYDISATAITVDYCVQDRY